MKTSCSTLDKLLGIIFVLFAFPHLAIATSLPNLGAASGEVTVSGLSSGGFMAVQFEVAHSRLVKGAGILAGGPYYCAEGAVGRALANCMSPSVQAQPPSVSQQKQAMDLVAKAGTIDPPDNLRNHRVWLFSGGNDRTVDSSVVDALHSFYKEVVPASALRYTKVLDAGHALISVADEQANACASSEPPFINRCRNLDAAGELLAHLIGPLNQKSAVAGGDLVSFDQRPFVSGKAIDASLADEGYVYIPKPCRAGRCRVHVVFHGCRQNSAEVGRRFVEGAGYNTWADTNRLIVLYPQTVARSGPALGSWKTLFNPKGCWDWWGYSGSDYHSRDGVQIRAIKGMLEQLEATGPR